MSGFTDFLKPTWLLHILDWQRDEGCYGLGELKKATRLRRRKREDRIVGDDCSSHSSAVAVASLTQFATHMLDWI